MRSRKQQPEEHKLSGMGGWNSQDSPDLKNGFFFFFRATALAHDIWKFLG